VYNAQMSELGHECPAIDQSTRLLLRATQKGNMFSWITIYQTAEETANKNL